MKQHLISQVLLKRWTKNRFLQPVHLQHGLQKLKTPKAVAYIEGLTGTDSEDNEAEWNQIESSIPKVFKELDDETFPSENKSIAVLRDFLELHFARSYMIRDGWFDATDSALKASSRNIRDNPDYDFGAIFRDMTGGLSPIGPQHKDEVVNRLTEKLKERLHAPELFAERIAENGAEWKRRVLSLNFEVSTFDRDVLVIGDRPVVPYNRDGRCGFFGQDGVPFDEADAIVFPLGPRHLLSLTSGEPSFTRGTDTLRQSANRLQLKAAGERFFAHPDTNLEDEQAFLAVIRADRS